MDIFTIGFTQKSAEEFFGLLQDNGVTLLVDIRLSPNSQLAGFTKQDNLPYFLDKLIGCGYKYEQRLAPSKELLGAYRKDKDWAAYEKQYLTLLAERGVPGALDKGMFEKERACLLCSEPNADFCHRRLPAEYLQANWDGVTIIHI